MDSVMHPCSFSNGGTRNLTLILLKALTKRKHCVRIGVAMIILD